MAQKTRKGILQTLNRMVQPIHMALISPCSTQDCSPHQHITPMNISITFSSSVVQKGLKTWNKWSWASFWAPARDGTRGRHHGGGCLVARRLPPLIFFVFYSCVLTCHGLGGAVLTYKCLNYLTSDTEPPGTLLSVRKELKSVVHQVVKEGWLKLGGPVGGGRLQPLLPLGIIIIKL